MGGTGRENSKFYIKIVKKISSHCKQKVSPELGFWLLLILLNALLFVPRYILDISESSFFPNLVQAEQNNVYSLFKQFFIRQNHDIFRISFDFLALTLLFSIPKNWSTNWRSITLFILYFIFLAYQTYSAVFEHIYHTNPLFYNDLSAIKTGFLIVYSGFSINFLMIILLLLVILLLLFKAIHFTILKSKFLGKASKIVISILLLLLLFNLKYGFNIGSANSIQYQSVLIVKNIQQSILAQKNLAQFSVKKMQAANNYQNANLQSKPNIVVIAIESYGEILLEHPELQKKYREQLQKFQKKITENGFYANSALSISPVKGGMSWVAYSNFNLGFNVKNQGTYDALLNKPDLRNYDDFFKTFKKYGYKNYRLVPILKTGKIVIPWELYASFYSVDEWITFENLNYNGALFGFGPAPPDQFSLNKAKEIIDKQKSPYTLFFLTVSSHNPFLVPNVTSKWKTLNQTKRGKIDGANLLVKPTLENYSKAIDYELSVVSEFIVNNRDSNTIYVIFGDHQPPFIADNSKSFATPLHIISKNKKFNQGFLKYGFSSEILPDTGKQEVYHEGIYSLFMIEFIRVFGQTESLPNYLPKGIQFK